MIPVTKPSMPDRARLDNYLTGIYSRGQLTNNGPLAQELTVRLEEYLGVRNLLLVATGTTALQVAYRALGVADPEAGRRDSAITTPFTFVATESSLRWEGVQPRFADICPQTLNLQPATTAGCIDSGTKMIVPVHVYGNPCDVEALAELADRHAVKLVYDAAHAFGVDWRGKSILNWGDAATLSFHATKIFHTVEGGAIVFKDGDALERAREMVNFGFANNSRTVKRVGINAKLSEVHAAFGLALLDEIDSILERRCALLEQYTGELPDSLETPQWNSEATRTGAYVPVLFESKEARERCEQALQAAEITARRYFSPCLGSTEEQEHLPVARSAADRALCLPIYADMSASDVTRVTSVVAESLG